MTFGLGVDLGTTFTAAATARDDKREMTTLGDRAVAIPSVVMIRDDHSTLIGEVADRQAASTPSRVAREVKRRLGDPAPLILGGEPYSAAQLLARTLASVVSTVAEREGEDPETVVLTHPANWGPYKRELFESVPRLADLPAVTMITEPEAAAAHYASNARVATGSVVAVYDLGGGTFDATVLRKLDHGFELLGPPEGVEGLGGIDFDEAVFAYVDRCVDGAASRLDLDDPQDAAALIRLRQECVLAKETLSADTEASISVLLPAHHTDVRLTRSELEEMIRSPIESTVSSLRRALVGAQVEPEDLTTVLLVGGSSRIPLVSQMLSAELGRPTVVDTHPKHAVALGAALMADPRARLRPAPSSGRTPTTSARPSSPSGSVAPPSAPSSLPPVSEAPAAPTGPTAAPAAAPTAAPTGPSASAESLVPTLDSEPTGDTTPPTSVVAAPGAGVPPPTLDRSRAGSQSISKLPNTSTPLATDRRRVRTAAIAVAVAALLGLGVAATATALTDRAGLGAPGPGTTTSTTSARSTPRSP